MTYLKKNQKQSEYYIINYRNQLELKLFLNYGTQWQYNINYFSKRYVVMEGDSFVRGRCYMIVCKDGDRALKIAQSNSQSFQGSRVDYDKPDKNDIRQLFFVQQTNNKEDGWEITNAMSCMSFDEQKREVRLKKGKQAKDQLFKIEKAPNPQFYQYYWLKTDKKGTQALELEGILRIAGFNQNKESQMFRFQQVLHNPTLDGSTLIRNRLSGKYIDVPQGSFKKQTQPIQWTKNERFNQRWIISRQKNGIVIQSLLNNLALDVYQGKKKAGTKVILWDRQGSDNQRWILDQRGDAFILRCGHDQKLMLAIDKAKVDDGYGLQITDKQDGTHLWIFEGKQP